MVQSQGQREAPGGQLDHPRESMESWLLQMGGLPGGVGLPLPDTSWERSQHQQGALTEAT